VPARRRGARGRLDRDRGAGGRRLQRHGRWQVDQRRLDISIKGDFPQPDAHGIIGQSYQDNVLRHGKLDEYGVENIDIGHATSDGWLPPMTTSAQAEGAIEGVHTDYSLNGAIHDSNVWNHVFRFSRYRLPMRTKKVKVGDKKPWQRIAFTNEWEGLKHEL
jgi:hypothetical protein